MYEEGVCVGTLTVYEKINLTSAPPFNPYSAAATTPQRNGFMEMGGVIVILLSHYPYLSFRTSYTFVRQSLQKDMHV